MAGKIIEAGGPDGALHQRTIMLFFVFAQFQFSSIYVSRNDAAGLEIYATPPVNCLSPVFCGHVARTRA